VRKNDELAWLGREAGRRGSLRHGKINQAVRTHRKRQKPERALMKAPMGMNPMEDGLLCEKTMNLPGWVGEPAGVEA